MSYRYSVVRLVPYPTRGEFLNIGVVVTDGTRYVVETGGDPRVVSVFSPNPWTNDVIRHVFEHAEWEHVGLDRCAEFSGVIQFSRPLPVDDSRTLEGRARQLAKRFLRTAEA